MVVDAEQARSIVHVNGVYGICPHMRLPELSQRHHNLLIVLSQWLEVVLDHVLECSAECAKLVAADHNYLNDD